jgi:heptosyltransferase-2
LDAGEQEEGRRASRPKPFRTILIVAGEADQSAVQRIQKSFEHEDGVRFAHQLPLPQLTAVLSHCTFIGHDSGISHLAAAAGARCVLLFGPTDPNVWAPQNENVTVVCAPNGDLTQLDLAMVYKSIGL